MSNRALSLAAAFTLAAGFTWPAQALTTLTFTTTVSSVDPTAPGFPSSLSGLVGGETVSGTLTYDATAVPSANPFPGTFGTATYYSMPTATFTITVGGQVFDTWNGSVSAFVWNDQTTAGSGLNDGLLFTNIGSPGNAQFQLGNILLPTSALGSTALPSGAPGGAYITQMNSMAVASPWFTTPSFALATPVPEPGVLFLWAAGLAGLLPALRRRQP